MNKTPRVGLGVLIFKNKNEVLLGRRIGSHGESSWGPPGGHLEFEESFEECAIREVLEEVGIKIENPKFLAVTNDLFIEDQKHYVSIFMTAFCPLDQAVQNLEPHKVQHWQWFDMNNLPTDLFLPMKQLVAGRGYGEGIELMKNEII